MKRILILAVLCAVAGCGNSAEPTAGTDTTNDPATAESLPTLRFSAIPDQNSTQLREKFDAIAVYLSDTLDVPVEYVAASDYKASVEMFRNGEVQLAWFGGLTGVQARQSVPEARAIAQGEEDPNYRSYFIAHKDTGLERSNEFPLGLAGLKFTFGSESSTSGRLMPEFFLRKATQKSPSEFFGGQPAFSGNHDKTVELVESGQYQAGAVNYKVYDQRVADGETDPDVCRIIWVTPDYSDYNFTAHPDLETMFGAGFIDRLQTALIKMDDPSLLAAFPRNSLIAAENKDFDDILEVAISLGFVRLPADDR